MSTVKKPQQDAQAAARQAREEKIIAGRCVAEDGRPHVGRAVNGLVCSAHAVSYKPDGTPRG